MGPSWGQVGAKLGPKTKRKGEVEAEEQEKEEEQEDLQGFAGFARNLGPTHEKVPGGGAPGGLATHGCRTCIYAKTIRTRT